MKMELVQNIFYFIFDFKMNYNHKLQMSTIFQMNRFSKMCQWLRKELTCQTDVDHQSGASQQNANQNYIFIY